MAEPDNAPQLTIPRVSEARPGRPRRHRVPLPLLCLAAGILGSYLPGLFAASASVRLSYLGWIVPLVGGAVAVAIQGRRVRFPVWIWLPWVAIVLVYLLGATAANSFQRGLMLLTPLVVGAAFSTLHVDVALLDRVEAWLVRFTWIFIVVAGVATGLLSSGRINATSSFAAGSITASLLAAWFAVRFATFGHKRDLLRWLLLAAVPVLANTRTGMFAVALTLPLTFAPWTVTRRVLVVVCLLFVGVVVFQSDRIQSKMFSSGRGSINDAVNGVLALMEDADSVGDFATNGRLATARILRAGVPEAYWFGHGSNTTEAISVSVGGVSHPHNDWLRIWYEYGTVGLVIFAIALFGQAWHAFRFARRLNGKARVLMLAGSGAVVPMAIFMFSDNIILYAAWFGNLQFAMLGLGYASRRNATAAALGQKR